MNYLNFLLSQQFGDYYKFARNMRKFSKRKHPSEEQIDFFYPNACQVCGCLRHLMRCTKCQMISYCGKQHQTEHWQLHKYFCNQLADLRTKNSFLQNAKDRGLETWMNAKISCINSISKKLGRNLTSYEKKMIKFTRACCVCHDINQRNLISCQNCASVSICHTHRDRFHLVHTDEKCASFKLCYQLDREKLQLAIEKAEMKKKSKADKKKKKEEDKYENESDRDTESTDESDNHDDDNSENNSDVKITEIKSSPMNLIPYFENKLPKSSLKFMENLSFDSHSDAVKLKDFEIPDLFLKPLSVFRSLQILGQLNKQKLTIHLMNGQINDLETCDFWETLLHLIPTLKTLNIIIFHREFSRQCLRPKLCGKCTDLGKNLQFELKTCRYNDYCSDDKTFLMPNLVIGFLTSLKSETNALKAIARRKVIPLALTNNCERIAKENHKYVERLFGKSMNHYFYEENPFCGLKPILDFKIDGFYYENQYLTIYKGFNEDETKPKVNGIQK